MSGFPNNSTQGSHPKAPHFTPLPPSGADAWAAGGNDSAPVDWSDWAEWFGYNYDLPHYILMDQDSDDLDEFSAAESVYPTHEAIDREWATRSASSQEGDPDAAPEVAHDILNTAFNALSGDGSAWAGLTDATESDAADGNPIALLGCTQEHHAAPHGGYFQ